MREQLVGHLLGALEPSESKQVESALADPQREPELRRALECLRLAVAPLARDRATFSPPADLARRTLDRVAAERSAARPASSRPLPTPHEWDALPRRAWSRAWIDRAIVAASALAACVLVAPLLLDSISQARARRAERNLMRTSDALQGYAESHRVFPTPPAAGPLSRAGLYAPTLVSDMRLVADDGTLVCPDSALARSGTFRVPTLDEVKAAVGTPGFEELVRAMGGDYGYTLGHRDPDGRLQANSNRRRRHHPVMADAPDDGNERSSNHPDGIHHVVFEDGHVRRIPAADIHRDDHLFKNHDGRVAAGIDDEDAVIGDSHHQP
jgi:hypothetical protein